MAMADSSKQAVLYMESSALLAWLLEEEGAPAIAACLRESEFVTCSALTIAEAERVLVRGGASGAVDPLRAGRCRERLRAASKYWFVLDISAEVLARAGRPFPVEPIRILDAIHISSALEIERSAGPLRMLSLDRRLRENADALGLEVLP